MGINFVVALIAAFASASLILLVVWGGVRIFAPQKLKDIIPARKSGTPPLAAQDIRQLAEVLGGQPHVHHFVAHGSPIASHGSASPTVTEPAMTPRPTERIVIDNVTLSALDAMQVSSLLSGWGQTSNAVIMVAGSDMRKPTEKATEKQLAKQEALAPYRQPGVHRGDTTPNKVGVPNEALCGSAS